MALHALAHRAIVFFMIFCLRLGHFQSELNPYPVLAWSDGAEGDVLNHRLRFLDLGKVDAPLPAKAK